METAGKAKMLPDIEVSAFCGQMAQILRSGISPAEGVSVMLEDAESDWERDFLGKLAADAEETGEFAGAMERSGAFPAYAVQMVNIGRETGNLDRVMELLSFHYEREDGIRRGIRSAVTYPIAMLVMMAAVIIVLLVKVMPIFSGVFVQLGSEMTGVSRLLMELGRSISRYGAVLTVLLVIIAALILWCGLSKKGRRSVGSFLYRLGLGRKVTDSVCASRVAGGLALTLSSGLSYERCMELASQLVDSPVYAEKLAKCRESVESGEEMAKALRESGIFTGVCSRLAAVGEKTGSLEEAMQRIADMYRDEVDNRLSSVLAVIEPVLVIALCLLVGAILLSVMLPLLGIMSGI